MTKKRSDRFLSIGHLFSLKKLQVSLNRPLRTLLIEITSLESDNISPELIDEFEEVLTWVYPHVEISFILINSLSVNSFSSGIDKNFLATATQENLERLMLKLRKLTFCLFHLPQLVIVDLKQAVSQLGIELCIGADIRIGEVIGELSYNHLGQGLFPAAGTFTFLSEFISFERLKKWLYLASTISYEELAHCAFIHQSYTHQENRDDFYEKLLIKLSAQSPIERIQVKKFFLEKKISALEKHFFIEEKFFKDLALTENWKRHLNNKEFIRPEEFSIKVHQEVRSSQIEKNLGQSGPH